MFSSAIPEACGRQSQHRREEMARLSDDTLDEDHCDTHTEDYRDTHTEHLHGKVASFFLCSLESRTANL